jgi:Cu+-exporting ATPase
MAQDPVCGMTVNPQNAAITIQYKGKTYYFCSQMCRMMFERDPGKYSEAEASATENHARKTDDTRP